MTLSFFFFFFYILDLSCGECSTSPVRHGHQVRPVSLLPELLHSDFSYSDFLPAIHTMAVNQTVTSLGRNVVLDDRPPAINISEKDLERTTLAQLRSGHCRLLGSYKSRISKDVSLDVCADCGKTPHDVKHLFNFPAHPTTITPSDLWNRPVDAIRELNYLETGILD